MRNEYLTTAKIALCSIALACAFYFSAVVVMQLDTIAIEDSNRLPVDSSRITTVPNPFE